MGWGNWVGGLKREGFKSPEWMVPEVAALAWFLTGFETMYLWILIFLIYLWISMNVLNLLSLRGGANLRPLSKTIFSSLDNSTLLRLNAPLQVMFAFAFRLWILLPPLEPLLYRDPFFCLGGPRENPDWSENWN